MRSMKAKRLIPWILCLSMLMLLCIVPVQAEGEEPEPEAANITKSFLFEANGKALNAYSGGLGGFPVPAHHPGRSL